MAHIGKRAVVIGASMGGSLRIALRVWKRT
jgi:hypothetical protein